VLGSSLAPRRGSVSSCPSFYRDNETISGKKSLCCLFDACGNAERRSFQIEAILKSPMQKRLLLTVQSVLLWPHLTLFLLASGTAALEAMHGETSYGRVLSGSIK